METLTVGECKARFSDVLKDVQEGREVIICFGKKKEKIAVIVPYQQYARNARRTIGSLKGRLKATFAEDFAMTDEELVGP